MITLSDGNGQPRATIHVDDDGGVVLGILGDSGIARLLYVLDADGAAVLLHHDADGVPMLGPAAPSLN